MNYTTFTFAIVDQAGNIVKDNYGSLSLVKGDLSSYSPTHGIVKIIDGDKQRVHLSEKEKSRIWNNQ